MRNTLHTLILCLLLPFGAGAQDTILLSVDLRSFDVIQIDSKEDPMVEYYRGNRFALTESTLERLPAINLVSRGNYAPEPIYRSLSGGQLNLSIDGMHIFSACTDKMDPVTSYIESNNLSSIDVDKHASNGSAIGACVDMKTAELDQQKGELFGQFATGFQSVSSGWNSAASIGFNQEKMSGLFTGSLRMHDSYKDGKGQVVNYTQFNKANFSAKLQAKLSDFQRLKFNYIYDDAWDVGYAALPMDVSSAKAHIYALAYEHFLQKKDWSSFKVRVYGNNIVHIMDDSKRPDVPIRMDMPGWSNTYGSFAEVHSRNLKGHRLMLKLDLFVNDSKAEMTMYPEEAPPMYMLTWPDSRRWNAALFAKDHFQMDDNWTFDYSARMEFIHSDLQSEFGKDHLRILGYDVENAIVESTFNLMASADRKLDDKNNVSATVSWKERVATVSEYYGFFLFNAQDGFDYMGNPDLSKESSLQFDVGHLLKGERLEWKNSAYYYKIINYITAYVDAELDPMTIGANGVKVYQNIPDAQLFGLETSLILNWNDFKWINVLAFIHGVDTYGESLPQIAPLSWNSTLTYKHKKLEGIMEVLTSARKQDPRLSYGEVEQPAWAIMNLRANYVFNEKWRMQAGVENLFNSYYTTFFDWGGIPRPGRNIYLSLAFDF